MVVSKHLLFSLVGKIPILTFIFFRWVGSTINQEMIHRFFIWLSGRWDPEFVAGNDHQDGYQLENRGAEWRNLVTLVGVGGFYYKYIYMYSPDLYSIYDKCKRCTHLDVWVVSLVVPGGLFQIKDE